MDDVEGWPVGGGVAVAPLAQGGEHWPKVSALGGEAVVVPGRMLGVGGLVEDPFVDQAGQALVEDVAGDAESLLELVEAGYAQEGVPDDEHRPSLAHHLKALGHRAVHVGEALPFHETQNRGLHHRTQLCIVRSMTLSTLPETSFVPVAPRAKASPAETLVIVCAGVVLASLDLFIVNVALPQIARDLHASDLGGLSWVLNGYAIVYASLLVFFGRLADRYRRDRAFLVGVAVFTAASAACAAATSVGMLVGFRVLQAAGAALLTPTSLGLVLASHQAERRQGAVRAWTAVGGLAAAVGPVVGGLLVAASWRWVFLVNVPIGIAALVVGWRRLPAVPGHPTERPTLPAWRWPPPGWGF